MRVPSLVFALTACTAGGPGTNRALPASCGSADDLLACAAPTLDPQHYIDESLAYFDTMDSRTPLDEAWPPYAETVARWEWPPWLLLTAWTRENIEASDTLLRAYPSIVEDRDCRFFDTPPFGRCRVTFYYDAHGGRGCPIYEEFTFNDAGEITWIEAWSDQPALLPQADDDPWAEASGFPRLAARIPGLGAPDGHIDPTSPAMRAAVDADADVAEFVRRTDDWLATWSAELLASTDDMWVEGCGWDGPLP